MIAHIRKEDDAEQNVLEHLESTAQIASQIGRKLELSNISFLSGLLHDMGKNTALFSNYIKKAHIDPKSVRKGAVNHSSAGGKFVHDKFYKENQYENLTAQIISTAIVMHHGLIDCINVEGEDKYWDRINHKEDICYDEAEKNSKIIFEKHNIEELFSKSVVEIQNLYQKIKKIAITLDNKDNTCLHFFISCTERLILSILIEADRTDTANFMNGKSLLENEKDIKEIWKELEQKLEIKLNGFINTDKIAMLRRDMSQECFEFAKNAAGIYCLPVPTGGGKTYCSFRYALEHSLNSYKESPEIPGKERIIYTAPFLSILEQNADDIKKVFGIKNSEKYVLEVHSNIINDIEDTKDNKDCENYNLFNLHDNWDYPVILTTQVQLLNILFSNSTQYIRKMHRLTNSVIIIDEVQSIPVKCISLFNYMMNFLSVCCNTTVILCTATQPSFDDIQKKILYGSPKNIIKDIDKRIKEFKRVNIYNCIRNKGYNSEELADFILEQFKDNMLVILNTKTAVKNLYNVIKNKLPNDIELVQLTTYMCPQNRSDIISNLKSSIGNKKVIAISTQLIEAGVDISFNKVIRSLAGLDSILQAAGRCNRNGNIKNENGHVHIINSTDEDLSMLEDIKYAQKAMTTFLFDFDNDPQLYDNDYLSLKSIDRYYKLYFSTIEEKLDYKIKDKEYTIYDLLSDNRNIKDAYTGRSGQKYQWLMAQSFKEAGKQFNVIEQGNTIGLIVPYKEGKNLINNIKHCKDYNQIKIYLKKLQRYTVNMFKTETMLKSLIDRKAINNDIFDGTVYILDEKFYNDNYGITDELKHLIF